MRKNNFKIPKGQEDLASGFYDEINYEYEYDHGNASVELGDRVLDCGAYVGMFTDYAYRKGANKVYSVEADKEHFKCLTENVQKMWKTYSDNIINKATPPEIFNRKVNDDKYNPEVNFSIEEFLKTHHIDFIKMDIEGSEWPTLLNMEDDNIKKVKKWAIEVHLRWSDDSNKYTYGDNSYRDFNGHYVNKLLRVIEKFTRNDFAIAFKHIHTGYDIGMLYAWK